MSAVVQQQPGVRVETLSPFQTIFLADGVDITFINSTHWIFHLKDGKKLFFLRWGDELLGHWYDWSGVRPFICWMASLGLPVAPQLVLMIPDLKQAIRARHALESNDDMEKRRLNFLLERLDACRQA